MDTLASILKNGDADIMEDELDLVMSVSGDFDSEEFINIMNNQLKSLDEEDQLLAGLDQDEIDNMTLRIDPEIDKEGILTHLDYSDTNTGDFVDMAASQAIAAEREVLYDDGVDDELIDLVSGMDQ